MTTIEEELNSILTDLKFLPHTTEILRFYEDKYNEIKQREFIVSIDKEVKVLLERIEKISETFTDRPVLLKLALADLLKRIDVLNDKKTALQKNKHSGYIIHLSGIYKLELIYYV